MLVFYVQNIMFVLRFCDFGSFFVILEILEVISET